jgi:hypothetical protein
LTAPHTKNKTALCEENNAKAKKAVATGVTAFHPESELKAAKEDFC